MWFVRKAKTWISLVALEIYKRAYLTNDDYRTSYTGFEYMQKKTEKNYDDFLALIDRFKEDVEIMLKLIDKGMREIKDSKTDKEVGDTMKKYSLLCIEKDKRLHNSLKDIKKALEKF